MSWLHVAPVERSLMPTGCSYELLFLFWMTSSLLYGVSGDQSPGGPYAMYVWRQGWDNEVPGCDDPQRFLDWRLDDSCFTHTWNSPEKRQWLWDTCSVPGRPINRLFFYDTAFLSYRDCDSREAIYLRETLREGRERVPGLEIYALYSIGGAGVPEQHAVQYVVWYNTVCAQNDSERFAGVAVNNEDYSRYWSEAQMVDYLYNLLQIKLEADKQEPMGSLKAHFSVSWNWGRNDDKEAIIVHWRGQSKPIMRHFIDIFDSLDVQVAFITSDAMEDRLKGAEWDYAQRLGKQLLPTVYINKALPCQTTFFPFDENDQSCASWSHSYKTEHAMWREIDALERAIPGVRPVLHHFRGAYSSGGHTGWPKHG